MRELLERLEGLTEGASAKDMADRARVWFLHEYDPKEPRVVPQAKKLAAAAGCAPHVAAKVIRTFRDLVKRDQKRFLTKGKSGPTWTDFKKWLTWKFETNLGEGLEEAKSTLITRLFKRVPGGSKMLRGGKHIVMLVGGSAQKMGRENYSNVTLEDLPEAELKKLAGILGVK